MIRLAHIDLPPDIVKKLHGYQQAVNKGATYADHVALAKRHFGQRNRTDNKTFEAVKYSLTELCSGARRCCYCEDSVADEVEHIKPKDLYPEFVFVWENYLYACGPCYRSYRAHLVEYLHRRDTGVAPAALEELISGVRRMGHPTVWREMQRQHTFVPELRDLFDAAPEALCW
jgi:5-methylcytosine-specific restriction endonuclease McrA